MNSTTNNITPESRCTRVGLITDAALAVAKIAAGIAGRSSAMIADGVHSIGDCATDSVVLAMVTMGARGENDKYRYGHGKFETLAAMLIGIIMTVIGVQLFTGSATDVWQAAVHGVQPSRPEPVALVMAIVAIASKEALYRYTSSIGKRMESKALGAYAWHHRTDALSTLATLLGIAGAMFLGEHWRVLDPIAAMVVSVLIVAMAIRIALPAVEELLEKALPDDEVAHIATIIDSTPGVRSHHNLRTRRNGHVRVVDVHVKVDGDITVAVAHEITTCIERRLTADYSRVITYIHVEPYQGQSCCEKHDLSCGSDGKDHS